MPTVEEASEEALALVSYLSSHDSAVVAKAVEAVQGLSGSEDGIAALRATGNVMAPLLGVRTACLVTC